MLPESHTQYRMWLYSGQYNLGLNRGSTVYLIPLLIVHVPYSGSRNTLLAKVIPLFYLSFPSRRRKSEQIEITKRARYWYVYRVYTQASIRLMRTDRS